MILKLLIISKYTWKTREEKHEAIRQMFLLSPDIEKVEITFRNQDLGTPETYIDGKGYSRIKETWFEENISRLAKAQGFTHAGFQFSDSDGRRWGIASGHRGLNFRDGDFFGEFWIKANEHSTRRYSDGMRRNTYITDVPHEVGHEMTREGLTDMEMHDYDYQGKINNIEMFFRKLRITKPSVLHTLWMRVMNMTGIKHLIERPMLPLKDFERVTQHFLVPNYSYVSKVHNGTDWGVSIGTPFYCPLDLYVSRVFANHKSLGNACYCHFIYKGKQYSMRVLHLSKVPKVKTYLKGEVLGYSGDTGQSTGPHVHVDLWRGNTINTALILSKKGVLENLVDPYKFFKGLVT